MNNMLTGLPQYLAKTIQCRPFFDDKTVLFTEYTIENLRVVLAGVVTTHIIRRYLPGEYNWKVPASYQIVRSSVPPSIRGPY